MNQTNWLRFELKNLKTLSTIRLAATLWDNPTIQTEIESVALKLNEKHELLTSPTVITKWWQITEKVCNQTELINAPKTLLSELRRTTILMGQQVLCWIVDFIIQVQYNDVIFDVKYFKKIYWTADGLIDKLKIFRYWKKEFSNFPGFPDYHRNKIALYYLACYYWDEGYLRDNLKEIGEIIGVSYGVKEIKSIVHAMVIIVLTLRTDCKWKSTLVLPDKNRPENRYEEGEIENGSGAFLLLEWYHGSERALKYFYEKLGGPLKNLFLPNGVSMFYIFRYNSKRTDPYTELLCHKNVRNLVSFFNMRPNQLKSHLLTKVSDIYDIFYVFLTTWPYQYLCGTFLDFIWNDLVTSDHLNILEITLQCLDNFNPEYINTYKVTQLEILEHVLRRIPENVKLKYFSDKSNLKIYKLFTKSDFLSIDVIANDLKKYRFHLLNIRPYMRLYFEDANGSFENVKKYMSKFKISENFINNNLIEDLLCGPTDLFHLMDEILKWKCDSDEKIIKTKQEIDYQVVILNLLLHGKYDLIDKYLKWRCCDADMLKANFFKNKTLIQKIFWYIWLPNCKNDLEATKSEFLKLLKYFLKDEEVISFLNEQIIENESSIKTLCHVLLKLQHKKMIQPKELSTDDYESSCWPDLDEVFKFCLVSAGKVKEIKKKIKDDFDSWYRLYSKNVNEFLVLNALVKWISYGDEEREIIIKKYLEPDATAKFLYVTFCKSEMRADAFSIAGKTVFLRDWVAKYGNVNEIKERVKCIENILNADVLKITEMLNRFL